MRREFSRSQLAVLALVGWLPVAALLLGAAVPARAGGAVTLPDMQIKVPTDAISIGTSPGNGDRQLQFTHITWDAGAGPFELDPTYSSQTGTATFSQAIYASSSPGSWIYDHSVVLPVTGAFQNGSDYQFPLTRFTLNTVNSDGSLGAVVATSPKSDYCMTGDAYVGGVPNTPNQTFIPQSNCTDPTKPLGWSVGWGDQYDQTDSGQPIDLTGVPDGTYVLHATVDPQHVLTESDATNNTTDTVLKISGSSVTVVSQTNPGTTPPTVSITSPASGANVSGTVQLQASASATAPATVTSVQFLLDGQPLGSPVTSPPYSLGWTVGSTPPGSHLLSARARDSDGNLGTATPVPVVVVQTPSSGGGPRPPGPLGGTGGGQSMFRVRLLTWHRGVLRLVVSNLPKHARLSVELEFPGHRRPRFLNARGGRLRVRTARPRVIVLRVFIGKRRVGKAVTLHLGARPALVIANPLAHETLSGTVPVVAQATGTTAISSVRFAVDGRPIGSAVTHAPYVVHWPTSRFRSGAHRIFAMATDTAGNSTTATVIVTVANPPPPMTCFVLQARLSAEGSGVAETAPLHTAVAGETLLAFVSARGQAPGRRQAATVSGAGLRWRLVARANASAGDSEIWTATAGTILTGRRITAALRDRGFEEALTVIAMEGVKGVGSAAGASGTRGTARLALTTSSATSLVFAVGNGSVPSGKRALPAGWVALGGLGQATRSSFWSQYTNQPTGRRGSVVTVGVAAPARGAWNLAAAELVNSGE